MTAKSENVAPATLERFALRKRGVDLFIALYTLDQTQAAAETCRGPGVRIPAPIDMDSDSHRAGLVSTDHR